MLMTQRKPAEEQSLRNFMTVEEAVAHSGYADQYLRRLAREGTIHAVKFGHVWLVHEESLQAYMDQARRLGSRDKRFGPREEM